MIVRAENLVKSYEDHRALDGVSLEVKKGEIFCVMGHSGAGKTTLLRILALLERPDSGEYFFDGKPVNWSRPGELRKNITMVFQTPVMFNTTVFKNIAYGLKLRGYSRAEIEKKVHEVLSLVRLEGYEKRKAKTLSGGEKQRVAIARAIVLEPKLLLMDEPTANLDPTNSAIIEDIVKEITKKNGTTIVFSTHNMFQAKRLADRVAHMYAGRIVEVGKTRDIFENPENELTRKFINGELF
ncbi:ABC transporter ATP-binding protein [Thermococcus thioreducens]|uniref:Molybdate/tungstate import ATP-binding protein WtpC n=1 Tax=Thermococcus thioreducens TaxID=277988 RepID=A0A0Q2QPX5_9EURY|nr:phosphate ABC transporter ATP-binding protein [Thermococcus thioreducens]ASJ11753.1 phosphate ABC transporter ATP-binding protein [Thermococcus thioreducens]KQH81957.1 ABC transporter ATPase [Thermococcus thioreducens]SEW14484.1 tungstate transport system ATP-binding protein [Thermococcus thioreducens]